MNNVLRKFIYCAFKRHCTQLHNADYEVCRDFWCWLAYKLEGYVELP